MSQSKFAFAILALFLLPLIPLTTAQTPLPGISLTCQDLEELDVSPSGTQPTTMICTIENTSSVVAEKVEITNEWEGGANAEMQGASGEYTIDAESTEDFIVSFTGTKKQDSSNSYEYTIMATVTEWGPIPLNEPIPQTNDSVAGSLEIATYGSVELLISDVSTRSVEAGTEFVINLQFTNKGNDQDNIRVDIKNIAELKTAGFQFVGSEFVAESLAKDATSALREIKILAPNDVSPKLSTSIDFEAKSTNDGDAQTSEISIPVTVESNEQSGSLEGITEVSQDDMVLYGAIAGSVVILILLLGVISRSMKKKNAQQIAEQEQAIELAEEKDEFDRLDDVLDDISLDDDIEDDFAPASSDVSVDLADDDDDDDDDGGIPIF